MHFSRIQIWPPGEESNTGTTAKVAGGVVAEPFLGANDGPVLIWSRQWTFETV